MLDLFLVPEIAIEADGEGAPVELGDSAGRNFLVTLAITKILEQQSLDVSIWGSADGTEWGAKPLTAVPQKFYQGVHQLLMDLSQHSDIRFLKAKWHVNRWGVGDPKPRFTFMLKIQEQASQAAAD